MGCTQKGAEVSENKNVSKKSIEHYQESKSKKLPDNPSPKNNIIQKTLISQNNPDDDINTFLGINIGSFKTVYSIFLKEDENYVYKVILMNGNSRIIPSKICYSNHRLFGDNSKNFIKLNLNTSYNNLSRIIGFDNSNIYKEEFKYMYNSKKNIENINKIGSECIIADFIHLINDYYFNKLKINYDSCCLSVPDFYTPLQRQKLKLICETINMKNIKIYDESLAITMYYGYSKYKEIFIDNDKEKIVKKVLFIDIGHSKTSFILSIFKYHEFKVEKVLFNPNLGGRNIELLLYEYCIREFKIEESNITNKMKFRLIEEINKKIRNFSISDEIEIKVDSFYEDDDLELIIKEDTFIKIINDKIIKVIEELCDEIKSYMEINKIEIDSVECSGELIRIKKLQELFVKKGFVIPDDINEKGVSRTLLIDECASVGAALLDNFICGKCPYKKTLKKIIYKENIENNIDYSNDELKEKIKLFIKEQDEKEKLYDNFTEMKNEYKKYIYNLQKIDSVDDNIKEKLENLQSTLQNFEFKTQKDINDMKMIYDEIVVIAKNIIDSLIKKLTNEPNDCNVLIVDLLKIKEDLSHKSEFNNDKETIYKRLEDIYLNNWQK